MFQDATCPTLIGTDLQSLTREDENDKLKIQLTAMKFKCIHDKAVNYTYFNMDDFKGRICLLYTVYSPPLS